MVTKTLLIHGLVAARSDGAAKLVAYDKAGGATLAEDVNSPQMISLSLL